MLPVQWRDLLDHHLYHRSPSWKAWPILFRTRFRQQRRRRGRHGSNFGNLARKAKRKVAQCGAGKLIVSYLIVFVGVLNKDVGFQVIFSTGLKSSLKVFTRLNTTLYFWQRQMFRKGDLHEWREREMMMTTLVDCVLLSVCQYPFRDQMTLPSERDDRAARDDWMLLRIPSLNFTERIESGRKRAKN